MSSQLRALEALVADPRLKRLEDLLKRFNLFEAIGVVRQELRHSNLLAFLLDPSQRHSLGAVFLKELLQSVLLQTEVESAVSSSDMDSWKLNATTVQREWHHIDILVLDNVNRFCVIIENKIDTDEHSDQLNRYYKDVRSHYLGYKIVALHLTPDGDLPSSDLYHAVTYLQVCQVAERLVSLHRSTLDGDVVVLLEHYAQMLRRHIVSDSDVAELCRSIYQQHRQALDLIFEHRPDQQAQVGEFVRSLIEQEPSTILYNFAKGWINFSLQDWDKSLKYRDPITNGAVFPYLSFNISNRLDVGMWIGPGSQAERETVRRKAQEVGVSGVVRSLNQKPWSKISSFEILSPGDYQKSGEEIETLIEGKWENFLDNELPKMMRAVREEEWLWEVLPRE